MPIAFVGRSRLDLDALPSLVERPTPSFVRDYDASPEEGPMIWPLRFDIGRWGFLAAFADDGRLGGIALAFDTPAVDLLQGRRDLAFVWDLRVASERRGRGVGRALWLAALEWARARGCTELRVETQDTNVRACRFYKAMGCTLVSVERDAYEGLDEARLIWGVIL